MRYAVLYKVSFISIIEKKIVRLIFTNLLQVSSEEGLVFKIFSKNLQIRVFVAHNEIKLKFLEVEFPTLYFSEHNL